jgi:hypothetical protein
MNDECKFCGMPLALCDEVMELTVGYCCDKCWYGETIQLDEEQKENIERTLKYMELMR